MMLQSVARFREDRWVKVEIYSGAVFLVLWAHHVLGLTVRVQIDHDGKTVRTEALEQVPNRF